MALAEFSGTVRLVNLTRRALFALGAVALLLAACDRSAPHQLIARDERGQLDPARLANAAGPLLARGASVAVIVVERGDESGHDLTRRLGDERLMAGPDIAPPLLAIYVSYAPRFSELRAGARWSELLPAATLRKIREGQLNAALRADAPNDGVIATLAELEAQLAAGEALHTGIGRFVLIAVAVLFGVVLVATFVGGPFAALPRSLAGRLWAVGPIGRWQSRRRYRRDIELARGGLAGAAGRALARYRDSAIADEALAARRAALEARRAELASRLADDSDLLAALHDLRCRYGALADDAERLAVDVRMAQQQVAAATRRAATMMQLARHSFDPQPAGGGIAYLPFADISAALADCALRHAALAQAPATGALHAKLVALGEEHAHLEAALLALWREAFPESYASFVAGEGRTPAKARKERGSSHHERASGSSSSGKASSSEPYDDTGSGRSSSDSGSW